MHLARHFGLLMIGALTAFLTPTYLCLFFAALIALFDPDPRPFTGSGPVCEGHDETRSASPNGRWIAVSERLECEERSDPRQGERRIFIVSSLLDRAGHVATLRQSGAGPLTLAWKGNQILEIENAQNSTPSRLTGWCGVQPAISESKRP